MNLHIMRILECIGNGKFDFLLICFAISISTEKKIEKKMSSHLASSIWKVLPMYFEWMNQRHCFVNKNNNQRTLVDTVNTEHIGNVLFMGK